MTQCYSFCTPFQAEAILLISSLWTPRQRSRKAAKFTFSRCFSVNIRATERTMLLGRICFSPSYVLYRRTLHCCNSFPLLQKTTRNLRGHVQKLKQRSCHLEVRLRFFSQRIVKDWSAPPRWVISKAETTNVFKTHRDRMDFGVRTSVSFLPWRSQP